MSQSDRNTGLVGETGIKQPVRVATTANITLSGEQTIDGVAVVDGDRVLVKEQTTAANNGIYECDTGTWSRTKDCNGAYDLVQGSLVYVYNGTINGNKIFKCTTANTITIGTSSLAFSAMDIELSGQSRFVWCGTATGTANALTLTPAAAVSVLTAGLTVLFKSSASANNGATTIAVSGLPATAAQSNGVAMVGGEIEANKWYMATYEGSAFQVLRYAPALPLVGGTMTGDITMSGASIFDANASIAAHATTMDPWSLGNYVTLTGAAVTFTGMAAAPQAGAEVELYMNAAHVFADGAVFEVDGDQNYTATIGDRVLLRAKSTAVITVHPRKKDGTAVVAPTVATQADQETATSTTVLVTPGRQQYHPSAAKAWLQAGTTGNIDASYNITSVTDDGVGLITVTLATDFSGGAYAIVSGCRNAGNRIILITSHAAGSFAARAENTSAQAADDPVNWFFACFGDQ